MLSVNLKSSTHFVAYILIVMLSFVRCEGEGKVIPEEDIHMSRKDSIEVKNKANSNALIMQFNAVSGWDTLNNFSYQITEIFENKDKNFSFEGFIGDIAKNDSLFIVKIHGGFSAYFNDYLLELEITPSEFVKLEKQINPSNLRSGVFIFKPIKLFNTYPELSSEKNGDDDTQLTYDFSQRLMRIKGKMIDYYLFEIDE